MATAGDLIEITFNHPDLGAGILLPMSGEDSTLDPGGFRSADEDAGIDGGGNMVDQITRVRWSVETTISHDMNDKREAEMLARLHSSPRLATWTFTYLNGTVYEGKGKPVGDLKPNGQTGKISIKISGGGKLTPIT